MRKFLICLCTALMVVLFLAGDVSFAGPITFYTVEQDFKDAWGGELGTGNFSCSAAEPGGVCSGITPLNSGTNDGCFNRCFGVPLEFNAIDMGEYDAVGTGYLGVGLPAVGPKFFTDEARWTWLGLQPQAVGFKVIGDLINPVDVDCTYSGSESVLGVATVHGSLQGTFIGAISGEAIAAVDCVEQVDGSADFYGEMQFDVGNGPGPPPVPATGTWGMIVLLGLLMVGSLFIMRRGAEA